MRKPQAPTWKVGVGMFVLTAALVAVSPLDLLASTRSQALLARGVLFYRAHKWDQAYQLFDEAVRADPRDSQAMYYRGLVSAKLGLWNVAVQDLEQALQLNPEISGAALDLGVVYYELGGFDRAEMWLARARQEPASAKLASLFLGLSRLRRGDDAGAEPYLQEAIDDPQIRPTAKYYLGLALLKQGEVSSANVLFAEVRDEYPNTEVGRTAADYLAATSPAPNRVGAPAPDARRWAAYARGAIEYDSNVVLAPDDSTLQSSRLIGNEGDGRLQLGFGGSYRALDAPAVTATLGYDFSQSVHFNLTEFDLQAHRMRLDLASRPRRFQVGLLARYDFHALNYQSFFQEGSVTPWAGVYESEATATQAYYTFRGRDYFRRPFEPFLDSFNHALGLRQLVWFDGVVRQLSAGYRFDTNQIVSDSGEEFESLGHRFDLELHFPIRHMADASAAYVFRLEDYQESSSRSPSGDEREDTAHQLTLSLERELWEHWVAEASYIGVINASNLDPFEYSRHIFSVGIRYEF